MLSCPQALLARMRRGASGGACWDTPLAAQCNQQCHCSPAPLRLRRWCSMWLAVRLQLCAACQCASVQHVMGLPRGELPPPSLAAFHVCMPLLPAADLVMNMVLALMVIFKASGMGY